MADAYNAKKHPDKDLTSGLQGHGVAALETWAPQIHLAKGALGYAEPASETYGDHLIDEAARLWERLGILLGEDG